MSSIFYEFLQRNSVISGGTLPLVHTTEAYHLRQIWKDGKIKANPCDLFIGESLNYFFVGRPAYKRTPAALESEFWELPACFIVEFTALSDLRRIFPFDSAAFSKDRFPEYLSRMGRDKFELPGDPTAPSKIIGAFFGSATKYFTLAPKEKSRFQMEFSLDAFDAEIHALHKLAWDKPSEKYDDRRFCIEVQSGSDVTLSGNNLLALICPNIYLESTEFRKHIEEVWQAEPISYDIFTLNYSNYMYAIYERVQNFYKSKGLL